MSKRLKPVTLSEIALLAHRIDATDEIAEHPEIACIVMYGTENWMRSVTHGDLRTLLAMTLSAAVDVLRNAEVDDDKIPETAYRVLRDVLQAKKNGHDQNPG